MDSSAKHKPQTQCNEYAICYVRPVRLFVCNLDSKLKLFHSRPTSFIAECLIWFASFLSLQFKDSLNLSESQAIGKVSAIY